MRVAVTSAGLSSTVNFGCHDTRHKKCVIQAKQTTILENTTKLHKKTLKY